MARFRRFSIRRTQQRRAPRPLRRRPRGRTNTAIRQANTTTSQQSGLGTIVAKGVRTLTSILPGSTFLNPIADFVLKSIGVTEVSATIGPFSADVAITGLMAKLAITRANIVASNPMITLVQGSGVAERYFNCDYQDVRIEEVTFILQPDSVVATRSGFWHVGFTPYTNMGDYAEDKANLVPLSPDIIRRCVANASGLFQRPLVLTYRPRAYDGDSFMFAPLNTQDKDKKFPNYFACTPYGSLSIMYENLNRENRIDFLATEFAFNITMNAKFEFRRPIYSRATLDVGEYTFRHIDYFQNLYNDVAMAISSTDETAAPSKRSFYLKSDAAFKCAPNSNGKMCKVEGTVTRTVGSDDFDIVMSEAQ